MRIRRGGAPDARLSAARNTRTTPLGAAFGLAWVLTALWAIVRYRALLVALLIKKCDRPKIAEEFTCAGRIGRHCRAGR